MSSLFGIGTNVHVALPVEPTALPPLPPHVPIACPFSLKVTVPVTGSWPAVVETAAEIVTGTPPATVYGFVWVAVGLSVTDVGSGPVFAVTELDVLGFQSAQSPVLPAGQ